MDVKQPYLLIIVENYNADKGCHQYDFQPLDKFITLDDCTNLAVVSYSIQNFHP